MPDPDRSGTVRVRATTGGYGPRMDDDIVVEPVAWHIDRAWRAVERVVGDDPVLIVRMLAAFHSAGVDVRDVPDFVRSRATV